MLFRYAVVGIVSNLVGYSVYLLVTYLGATPKITISFLYMLAAAVGFWGHRKFTFEYKGKLIGAGIRYVIAHCLGYLINFTILFVMVDKLGYAHQWVQGVAIFVVAISLFLSFKFFVFGKPYLQRYVKNETLPRV